MTVVWRVEAVVHRRRESQRHVTTIAVRRRELRIDQQLVEGVVQAFGLDQTIALDSTRAAHDSVTRAHQQLRIGIDRARAWPELANEAVVNAAKLLFLGLFQLQIGERSPESERHVAHERLLDLAEPTHEARQGPAREEVRDEKV